MPSENDSTPLERVELFDTTDESEADAVQGLLESRGIEVQRSSLALMGQIRLQVPPSQVADAQRLVADYRRRNPEAPAAAAEESSGEGEPGAKLVDVFDTNDDSEVLVVKALLESGGMEVMIATPEAPAGVFPFSNVSLGRQRLLVLESQAEDARRVIEEYRRSGPQDAELAERSTEGAGSGGQESP